MDEATSIANNRALLTKSATIGEPLPTHGANHGSASKS